MGSPLSPVVANIVLERVERSALEQLHQEGIVPIFFRRYVDDCLSSVRREQVERMLEVFNSFHPRLQFTIELEEDGQIRDNEWIRKDVIKSSKYLAERNDLIVTKADKGKLTVVMNKAEYESKMLTLVNDTETYEEIRNDPTSSTLKKINAMFDQWSQEEWIDKCTKLKLKVYNCNPPRVNIQCSEVLSSILNGIVGKTDHHIVNSFEFVGDIRQHIVTNECALFSLDVVSLFTNVPVDYAIESVRLRWGELEEHTKIPESSFIAMLELVLTSTFFMHQGRFFKQKFGLPMGSPLSPVVANIVLERVERSALEQLHQEGIVPIFFRRYVDDCLSSVRREQVERMLEVFNSFHPRLQFTIELEEDGQIRFLDTIVRREEDHLTTE
ncbi:uncharacterized protein LOC131680220 [Topomyia yanbarensis]|uniref:uncharacterized protein LOC131680220 n=1 Tax=Topomyia yanbarensis TaxID=2498891 RepID=UPI00273C6139|nr:uncharacterized protein LOC131680220 [Topomyia yanbarensis]